MTRTLLLSALSAVIVALGGYAYMTASQSVSTSSEPFLAVNAQANEAGTTETTDAEADVTEMAMGDADARSR